MIIDGVTNADGSLVDGIVEADDLDTAALSTLGSKTGSVIAWPSNTIPDGFLVCDGSSLASATYSDLYGVIGFEYGGDATNFNLPDYRGEFLRGHGANDPDAATRTDRGDGTTGDVVGTKQAAELGSHVHAYRNGGGGANTAYAATASNNNYGTNNTNATGGNETRPRNVSVNYIIKY